MKISPVKLIATATLLGTSLCIPVKTGNALRYQSQDEFIKQMEVFERPFEEKVMDDLNIIEETNFRGGKIRKFDDKSVAILKERLMAHFPVVDYQLPIENKKNIYLEDFGKFFAKRPNGRPHLGLDIFATPYARKPKEPVLITSPINGVVISEKHARREDNVIANSITIMGTDGRRYGFEHMARAEDYPDYASIPLPKVGTYMHKGDSIGYIGHTGETSLWHLHLSVMTDEQLEYQKHSPKWQKIQANSPYSVLRGQVDPLDENSTGPLAKLLNTYRQ